jgi:hypothetical protein
MSWPWEVPEWPSATLAELEETVRAIQRDMMFAVSQTAVLVRSDMPELRMVANTARGQEIPKGLCTYSDGTKGYGVSVEFQDIGMPQIGVPTMTMQELIQAVHAKATELGLWLP